MPFSRVHFFIFLSHHNFSMLFFSRSRARAWAWAWAIFVHSVACSSVFMCACVYIYNACDTISMLYYYALFNSVSNVLEAHTHCNMWNTRRCWQGAQAKAKKWKRIAIFVVAACVLPWRTPNTFPLWLPLLLSLFLLLLLLLVCASLCACVLYVYASIIFICRLNVSEWRWHSYFVHKHCVVFSSLFVLRSSTAFIFLISDI